MRRKSQLLPSLLVALAACAHAPAPAPISADAQRLDRIPRAAFNQRAAEEGLSLYWASDERNPGVLDPDELAVIWGLDPAAVLDAYVKDGAFTPALQAAYDLLAQPVRDAALPEAERLRRAKVREELAQARPTLVASDFSQAPEGDKRFVALILQTARVMERLYARQMGVDALRGQVPADDPASHTLFFRNQGYKCESPRMLADPACSAIPTPPALRPTGLYPAQRIADPKFCESLAGSKMAEPFTVVAEDGAGALVARPYHEAFAADMALASKLLAQAAEALDPAQEAPLRAYLAAASKAFLDDDWAAADEAWARLDATNSAWYLRVGPDEVYAEPCSMKALFHLSFGRIDPGSLELQRLLDPLKGEMEAELARLAGPPYQARTVSFHLPDFTQIILAAGDSRAPSGATIGQSLPNFGAVANEGRGRTVAMTNYYRDPDSLKQARATAESMLCKSAMVHFTSDPGPSLTSTVLHEAAHNLGPAAQYRAFGKTDDEAFGGPLAATLEELKAQTAASYLVEWLAAKGKLSREQADQAHLSNLLWNFGHISRGMFDENGGPKNYSQLSAVQVGFFLDAGAIEWRADELAANGTDQGCFAVVDAKMSEAVTRLMGQVAGIKARGDRAAAEALVKPHVAADGQEKRIQEVITERVLRSPKASFVFSVKL